MRLIGPGMNAFVWMYRSHFTDAAKFGRSFLMQLNQLFKVFLPRIRRSGNATGLDIMLVKRYSGHDTGFINRPCPCRIMPAGLRMHHVFDFIMPSVFLVVG